MILTLILTILPSVVYSQDLVLPIIEIVDGDTIKTQTMLPYPLNEVSIRIFGIDTPEKPAKSYSDTGKLGRADCHKEAKLALRAKSFLIKFQENYHDYMIVRNYDWGKFGGRMVGEVLFVDKITREEVSVGELMIDQGFAVPYFGKAKTHDWCL